MISEERLKILASCYSSEVKEMAEELLTTRAELRAKASAAEAQVTSYALSPTDIYDFAGWLTTRPGTMLVGACELASPMADAVGEYLNKFPERFAPPAQAAGLTTPTLNASCVPEATKPKDKYTFVFPDASMTKIRYIFVDGEMVYENSESEQ